MTITLANWRGFSRLGQHSGRNLKAAVVEDWSVLWPMFLVFLPSSSFATSSSSSSSYNYDTMN